MAWPKQKPVDMNRYYGNPDANGDGAPDPKWEAANLVSIKPPYRMVLAWDTAKVVKTIRVHKDCAESLLRALDGILAHYGSQAAVEKARMHLFGGCYNFRLKRGGSTLSIHSWAAAIDLDPERNGFGVKWRDGKGMMPRPVIRIFETEGWDWGGPWSKPDAMHFQAAKTGQRPAAAAPPAGKPPVPATRTPAKAPAAPEQDGDPVVRALQEALLTKGFSEVGNPDGYYGTFTEVAIMAWEKYHGLPPTGEMVEGLLDKVLASAPRVISLARTDATPKEVRAEVPEVAANWKAKITSLPGAVFAAVMGFGAWLVENLQAAREWARPVTDIIGDVPIWLYLALIAGGLYWLWRINRKGEKAGLEAYRAGERR